MHVGSDQLLCWPPRGLQVLHQRRHVTRSPKQGYQWFHKKDFCPPIFFFLLTHLSVNPPLCQSVIISSYWLRCIRAVSPSAAVPLKGLFAPSIRVNAADNSAMMLAILISLKIIELLKNGLQPHSRATQLFSVS